MVSRALRAAFVAAALLIAVPAASQAAESFPLQGWWPMNEGSGQKVYDWSGHGNTGHLGDSAGVDSHDPSWIRGVFFGSALRFAGDDFVQIPDSSNLEPQRLTVSAWFRGASSPGRNKYIVAKGAYACNNSSYGLYSGDGGIAFYIADDTAWYITPQAPASVWDGNWHNAAGTYDGTTVRLYIDGQEVGSGIRAGVPIHYGLPQDNGTFGDFVGDCGLYLNGDIDGVQVWSKALPVADIWRSLKPLLTAAR